MAAYAYTAINADGLELIGEVHAPTADAAREQLRVRGLLAELLNELPASGEESVRTAFKKVKSKSLQVFSRQFATMVAAGLNIVTALTILEQQTDDQYLATVLGEVRADVEGGSLLSEALARHPKVFSRLYISMVEAGEAAGILDQVLDRVAIQIEKEANLKRRVKGALIYPTLVVCFALLILTAMLLFIIPIFEKLYKELGGNLPMLTQVMIDASVLMRTRWYIIFPALALSIFSFFRWKSSEHGRRNWDRFKLKVPMKIGDVVLKVTMARFARTLSTLVAAGVDIIKALEITGTTAGNWVVENALVGVREQVHAGVPIAQPLIEHPVFPPMVGQMVKIGEETGELDAMLGKIADFYEEEVDASIAALTSIIEPIMIILVGAMVGTIILSMYLPMFKLVTLVK
ncbi:MAG: type II secretion system F family protein [Actinobacteria bacterium]|nr:type II secretion system F family protein [Actinomycetota bacterium]